MRSRYARQLSLYSYNVGKVTFCLDFALFFLFFSLAPWPHSKATNGSDANRRLNYIILSLLHHAAVPSHCLTFTLARSALFHTASLSHSNFDGSQTVLVSRRAVLVMRCSHTHTTVTCNVPLSRSRVSRSLTLTRSCLILSHICSRS